MAEGIQSPDTFYINGSYKNTTAYEQLAEVLVTDDVTILERTEGYHVCITRFSVDTQSTMFFIQKDPDKRVCIELLRQHIVQGVEEWQTWRTFCFSVTDHMPTLTAFLRFWNSHQLFDDPVFPALSVDGAGRFVISTVFSKTVSDLAEAAHGINFHAARIQMTDPMTDLLGMETVNSEVTYAASNFRNVMDQLDFVGAVIAEDNPTFFLDDNWQTHLKLIAEHVIVKMDPVVYQAAGTNTQIYTKNNPQMDGIIGKVYKRWGKLFYEDTHDNGSYRSRSQYIYVDDHHQLAPAQAHYIYEYVTTSAMTTAPPPVVPVLGFNVNGTDVPWGKGAGIAPANVRVYPDEFYDLDLCFGQSKGVASLIDIADPTEPFLRIDVQVGPIDVQVGDILEMPFSFDAQGNVALYGQGDGFGVGAGFEDCGRFYSIPIVGVEVTANGVIVETSVPIDNDFALRADAVAFAAPNQAAQPSVFINSKRPCFIPQTHTFTEIAVNAQGNFNVPTTPVRVGDRVYIKRVDDSVLGPFPVLERNFVFPAGPSIVWVRIDLAGWPADYNNAANGDRLVIVAQGQVAWNAEDIRRLKIIAPAQMMYTVGGHATDWTMSVAETKAGHVASQVLKVFNSSSVWYEALASVPTRDQVRREPTSETFPVMYTTATNRLQLQPVTVRSAGNGPHTLIRTFNDTTYAHRRGRNYGFCILEAPDLAALLAHEPNERKGLNQPSAAPIAPAWSCFEEVTCCGIEGQGVILYTPNNALGLVTLALNGSIIGQPIANEVANTINSIGTREVDTEPGGRISKIMWKGNREYTIKLPGSSAGRPINLAAHDIMRSTLQGRVDLCQHWHSLLVTTTDLGCRPEQSNAPRSLAPILSSFLFPPTVAAYSADKYGKVNGYSETPYGTIQFNETVRRYHSLRRIPGDLRSFTIQMELAPRDNRLSPEKLMLSPGESMSFQLMFVRNF